MPEKEQNKLEVVFGHQYWGERNYKLLILRDVKTFTIMRPPLDKKISFFYHFYLRERGRKHTSVRFEEVRDFVLYNKVQISPLNLDRMYSRFIWLFDCYRTE